VIAVDTNLLVYAHRTDAPFHATARPLIESLAQGTGAWAIPWPCVHEFVAIVTNARIFRTATPIATAMAQLATLAGSASLQLLAEGEGYLPQLERLAVGAQARGGAIHDARIAALCLHHGVSELWSADRDFSRFPTLRTRNPLAD
jgi:toxin-antitoxin system PIN domain toxin